MSNRAWKYICLLTFYAITMTWATVSVVKSRPESFALRPTGIRPDGLPAITFLGVGPSEYVIDSAHTFVVKRKDDTFMQLPGPFYDGDDGQRVWDFEFVPDDMVILENSITTFGQVAAGEVVAYALIDDDVNARTSYFAIDDTLVHETNQGMVVYGDFVMPRSGELLFSSRDDVAVVAYNTSVTRTPAPTVTPTLTPTPTSTPPPGSPSHVFTQSWGGDIGAPIYPEDMVIWNDKLFILDGVKLIVEVFDFHGRPLYDFPLVLPDDDPPPDMPDSIGIEVDPAGYLFVALDGSLAKYSPDGRLVTMWLADFIHAAQGFAIGVDGSLYWTTGSNQIRMYSNDFEYVATWGGFGSDNGQLDNPGDLAVDTSGDIYVADRDNYRIQKFSREGVYIGQWGRRGSAEGQFETPGKIAVSPNGRVYVTDSEINRIQSFDLDGNYESQWAGPGAEQEQFTGIASIAVTHAFVFVGDGGDRIYKFTNGGEYLTGWGINGSGTGQLRYPVGIANADGIIYVADGGNDRVQTFTRDGSYISSWGNTGSGEGQFERPGGIEVSSDGYVYVIDRGNFRVQKFSTDGDFILQWGSEGAGPGQFAYPWDLAVDQAGFVYVVDWGRNDIQKFTAAGEFVTSLAHDETGSKYGIAVDSQGYIYTVNLLGVQKFGPDGALIAEWGAFGSGAGQFDGPQGIAVDSDDRVYVADTWNRRIQVFTPEGEYLSEIGGYGSGDGQFLVPLRVAVDSAGSVFVSDNRLGRIQRFDPHRPPTDPVSGLITNGSFESTPELDNWTYGHDFGEPRIAVTGNATDGDNAVQLGQQVPQAIQDRGTVWLHQTIYVDPNWQRPLLSFDYRMVVNDTIDYSDFHVWLASAQGSWQALVLRDGFRSCNSPATAPPEGFDMGWRSATYDLSQFRGETIRIRFENRNLHHNLSLGAWTYIDNVKVLNVAHSAAPNGASMSYLPLINWVACDEIAPSPAGSGRGH